MNNDNLLKLFFVCKSLRYNKYNLFCRFLVAEEADTEGYFDELLIVDEEDDEMKELPDVYPIPCSCNMEAFYSVTHYKYKIFDGGTLVDGYRFGIFDSFEEAETAAKQYSAKELIDKFFDIHNESAELAKNKNQ